MTDSEWIKLERLWNLVQPGRITVDPRTDRGWKPIALFEEAIKATDEETGLRVQVGSVWPNDARLNPLHPDNEKQYHMANLIAESVNAMGRLLRERAQGGAG